MVWLPILGSTCTMSQISFASSSSFVFNSTIFDSKFCMASSSLGIAEFISERKKFMNLKRVISNNKLYYLCFILYSEIALC